MFVLALALLLDDRDWDKLVELARRLLGQD
jgi:hypothetical protein